MTARSATTGRYAQIVVVDPAYLPLRPQKLTRKRAFLLGALAAAVLGLALAGILSVMDDHFYDRTDVERLASVPLLVVVPRARRGGRGG
jgi:hypothetical protein